MNVKKIAIAGPFTGHRAAYGKQIKHTLQPFLSDEMLDIHYFDDGADVDMARNVALTIIDHQFDVVIGHFNSYCALSVRTMYQQANMPLVLPASTSYELNKGVTDLVYRYSPDNKQQCQCVKQYFDVPFTVISDRSRYGNELKNHFDSLSKHSTSNYFIAGTYKGCADIVNKNINVLSDTKIVVCDDCDIDDFWWLLEKNKHKYVKVISQKSTFFDNLVHIMTMLKQASLPINQYLKSTQFFNHIGQANRARWILK